MEDQRQNNGAPRDHLLRLAATGIATIASFGFALVLSRRGSCTSSSPLVSVRGGVWSSQRARFPPPKFTRGSPKPTVSKRCAEPAV
eukprot:572577-Prymnesium_polylepis.1